MSQKKNVKKEEINIQFKYDFYLNKVELSEKEMHPIQRREMKNTFFGACGLMLRMLRDELSEFPEDEGVELLKKLELEIANYFLTVTGQQN